MLVGHAIISGISGGDRFKQMAHTARTLGAPCSWGRGVWLVAGGANP